MSQLPIADAVTRFQSNEERVDKFSNEFGTYTTSAGIEVQTLPSLVERFDSIAESVGAGLLYATKALATEALAGIPDMSLVDIIADESQGGRRTRYRKESGALAYKFSFDKLREDLAQTSGLAQINTASGLNAQVELDARPTSVYLASNPAAASIGTATGRKLEGRLGGEANFLYGARAAARVSRSGNALAPGSITILGDSITTGTGASDLSKSYASLIQEAISDFQGGGYGLGNEANFDWVSMGNVALAGVTSGTSGPIQRSKIIAVGGTITISRSTATKIAFYFDKTPTSGSVEVRQSGVLLATIDCSGVAAKSVLSAYVNISAGGANVEFKVISAPVEFLAMVPITDNVNQPNVLMNMRMAVSGWNSSHFLQSPDQLISIGTCGAIGGTDSIYVLAVGTNDIYTAARIPSEYTDNLRTIGTTLESYRQGNVIVLVVPPIPDESIYPVAIDGYTHADYKEAIYALALERKWAVVDHSNLRLLEQSLYVDGLHPNDRGHAQMASNILKTLGISLKKPVSGAQLEKINAKSDAVLYRRSADLTTFTGTTTRQKSLTSMGVTSSDFVTGVYLRWKTSGVMIPIEHCQEFAVSGRGIQMLRSYTGAAYSVAILWYSSPSNDGTGFANPQGPLSASIINTTAGYADAEVIVEFIRSLKIS